MFVVVDKYEQVLIVHCQLGSKSAVYHCLIINEDISDGCDVVVLQCIVLVQSLLVTHH